MKKLNLQKKWLEMTPEEKEEMAEKLMTPITYLTQVCNGHSTPGRLLKTHIAKYFDLDDPNQIDLKHKRVRKRSAA